MVEGTVTLALTGFLKGVCLSAMQIEDLDVTSLSKLEAQSTLEVFAEQSHNSVLVLYVAEGLLLTISVS